MKENTKKERKQWSKPELIVLVRGTPEEAVLAACKTSTTVTGGGNQACKKSGKPCITRSVAIS